MAVFKFSLAPVLRLRARVKEEKQWELRALNEARHAMQAEIGALEQERHATGDRLGAREGEFLSVVDLQCFGAYAQLLDKRIKEKTAAMTRLDQQIAEKQGELIEAMRAVKSLERLADRQAEKFRREQDAAEQKFVDEVARRKYISVEGRKKIPQ